MPHQVWLVLKGSRLNHDIYDAVYFPLVREYDYSMVSAKILLLTYSFREKYFAAERFSVFVDSIVTF